MIDDRTISERWQLIAVPTRQFGTWRLVGLGNMLEMKASIEAGVFHATFRAYGRLLTEAEEQQLVAACQVPADAERVPQLGQEQGSAYRKGIVGGEYWQVVYRWKL